MELDGGFLVDALYLGTWTLKVGLHKIFEITTAGLRFGTRISSAASLQAEWFPDVGFDVTGRVRDIYHFVCLLCADVSFYVSTYLPTYLSIEIHCDQCDFGSPVMQWIYGSQVSKTVC